MACRSMQQMPVLLTLMGSTLVDGHAYIFFPPMRGGTSGNAANGYCPQCIGSTNLPMPVCGKDSFETWTQGPLTPLTAGQKVQVQIKITAHHKGHFILRLCDKQIGQFNGDAEACLNERPLQRVKPEEMYSDCKPNDMRGDCIPFDEANPSYWYLPPVGLGDTILVAGTDFKDSDTTQSQVHGFAQHNALLQLNASSVKSSNEAQSQTSAGANYHFHYWIPKDVTCDKCTIQWRWQSANSCTPHTDAYNCYFQKIKREGWDADSWCSGACSFSGACPATQAPAGLCGEEFINCADVSISSGDGSGGSPAPLPPSPAGGGSPSSNEPTPAAPTPPAPPAACTDCKNKCQTKCEYQVAINQCWGTPRFIKCQCKDGSTHSFPGCKCEHQNCPATPAPEVEPEAEPEPEPVPTPEPMPQPEPQPVVPTPQPEPTPPVLSGGTCVQNKDESNPWWQAPGFDAWCAGQQSHGAGCPSPQCVQAGAIAGSSCEAKSNYADLGITDEFCKKCSGKQWCKDVVAKVCQGNCGTSLISSPPSLIQMNANLRKTEL